MSQATPILRDLAKRLIVHEARRNDNSVLPPSTPAFQVFEKFRPHLTRLIGTGGYFALCSRALALASAEVVWLGSVSLRPGGALQGVVEGDAKIPRNEAMEGEIVLVSQLLGLLATFIGHDLMLRQVQEVWPELDFV